MQTEISANEVVVLIEVDRLIPHPLNREVYGDPRDSSDYAELINSIRAHGVLEPIIVDEEYTVLSGHRRLAAAIDVGLRSVPTRKLEGMNKQAQEELIIMLNQYRKRSTSVMVREAIVIECNERELIEKGLRQEDQRSSRL